MQYFAKPIIPEIVTASPNDDKLRLHEQFMRRAIWLATENVRTGRGGPFGAVIVKNGEIIAEGVNEVTSSLDPTHHAEVAAIRNACKKLNDFKLNNCIIYTSCEPCPMCLASIYWARLDGIYYAGTQNDAAAVGFDDRFLYEEIAKPVNSRKIQTLPLLRNEAKSAFDAWRDAADKIPY